MNLFWLLTLAHFIADFPLQTDRIFALKSKYKWGVLPHIFISFVSNIIVAFPLLTVKIFWIAVVFLACIHFILDWLKILVTQNLLSDSMLLFLLDQVLHIFFIWLTCFYLFDIPSVDIENKLILTYFYNEKVIIALTGLVFSIFGGGVLIHYIRKIIHRIKTQEATARVPFPNVNKRRIGYIERFFATYGTILGGWFLFVVPLGFIFRLIVRRKIDGKDFLIINLVSGLIISIGAGLLVRLFW